MANEENLIPFNQGKDSRRNMSGAPKSITNYLKDFGESKSISFHIEMTNTAGATSILKGKLAGKGKNGTINQIIATQLLAKAVKGDLRAIQELLDRTEGKPKQAIELGEFFKNGVVEIGCRS